jgi:hypothetical protein
VERNSVDIRGPVPHLGGGFGLHALLLCLTRSLLNESNKRRNRICTVT